MLAMAKRRLIRWSLILAILAAFAVWLEPTRVIWGWLRGEAFYQGRPTSYWASEIGAWEAQEPMVETRKDSMLTARVGYERRIGRFRGWLDQVVKLSEPVWPPVLDGGEDAEPALRELASHRERFVQEWAEVGLKRLRTRESGPSIIVAFREVRDRYDEKSRFVGYTTIDGSRQCVRVPGKDVCVEDVVSDW